MDNRSYDDYLEEVEDISESVMGAHRSVVRSTEPSLRFKPSTYSTRLTSPGPRPASELSLKPTLAPSRRMRCLRRRTASGLKRKRLRSARSVSGGASRGGRELKRRRRRRKD